MYDANLHVRVRLLSSESLPVDLTKYQETNVEQDNTSSLLKTSTYTNSMESVKVGITEMWNYSKSFTLSKKNEQIKNAERKDIQKLRQNGVVVMHVHGGGFVAMSSCSHQNYTRIWANSLEIPVFSVDYRLSPESRFPDALNDCWQVYFWLLE